MIEPGGDAAAKAKAAAEARKSWAEYHENIDRLLDKARPARISAKDKAWREAEGVYGWARTHIPNESDLVRHFAEKEVDRREAQATKRGNDFLRRWMHGQAPLSWDLVGPLPVVIGHGLDKLRVRLDVATPDDIVDASDVLDSERKRTYDEVGLLIDGLRYIAQKMVQAGCVSAPELGTLPPREDADPSFLDEDDEEDDEDEDEDA